MFFIIVNFNNQSFVMFQKTPKMTPLNSYTVPYGAHVSRRAPLTAFPTVKMLTSATGYSGK